MPITDPELADPVRHDGRDFSPSLRRLTLIPDWPWHKVALVSACSRMVDGSIAMAKTRGWIR